MIRAFIQAKIEWNLDLYTYLDMHVLSLSLLFCKTTLLQFRPSVNSGAF